MKFLILLSLVLSLKPIFASDLHYFKPNYDESDRHFTEIFNEVKKTNPAAEVFQFLYPHGSIKSYFIPAKETQQNLLVLISGTHGIEAFTGSAVQRYLLSGLQQSSFPQKNTAILFIHGFNLWGFKNYRRVNENNIDLNRNFIIDRNKFKSDDSGYALINKFLNPEGPASAGIFSHAWFLVQAVYNISRYSLETLRNSVLQGQYSFEKGIYYGGKSPQAQELLIDQLIERYFSPYKKVFLIDLHTGYGERYKLHLLAGKSSDSNSQNLKKVFPEREIDFSDKEKFYTINGEMLTFFGHRISQRSKAEVIGITFEYGTMDSQKTSGSIESIRRVILENQNFQYPQVGRNDEKIKLLYREMFYPSEEKWRLNVLKQTDEKMQKVYRYLEN